MQSIFFRVDPGERDALIVDLWEAGTAGIIEEGDGLRAFFGDDSDLSSLNLHGSRVLQWRIEDEVEGHSLPGAEWEPFPVGEKFFVAPARRDVACPSGRYRLNIDSDTAFGTGRHESTQLMMEALERYVQPQQTVLDLGCGSGILSAAALALGANRVFACDIHPDAIATARRHVAAPLFIGAVDAVATSSMDVVLVNISAGVIDLLANEIQRAVRPGGLIFLSGFIDTKTPAKFSPDEVLKNGEWQCWVSQAAGITAKPNMVQPFAEQWWL